MTNKLILAVSLMLTSIAVFGADSLSEAEAASAQAAYLQYCALCHGEERQGHVNDHAPSLRSESLMATGAVPLRITTSYGRLGTPMAGYLDEVGGPMTRAEIRNLSTWLVEQSPTEPVEWNLDPVLGDVEVGKAIYSGRCAECHGLEGEGGTGTALGNPAMLSLMPDQFLRYAIQHGRSGTDMASFSDVLTVSEIDSVTAFIRSRAAGWAVEKPVLRTPPSVDQYILNPDSKDAQFELKDGHYVLAADLLNALQSGDKLVLLDTRAMSMWQMVNIAGSVPLPYYRGDIDALTKDLPPDGTMIVTYCECPRAAADYVNAKLTERGFTNTAVLWEGIGGWVSLGYPVMRGDTTLVNPEDI